MKERRKEGKLTLIQRPHFGQFNVSLGYLLRKIKSMDIIYMLDIFQRT